MNGNFNGTILDRYTTNLNFDCHKRAVPVIQLVSPRDGSKPMHKREIEGKVIAVAGTF